jgi:multidrug efflux pump subunit AcrB
VLRLSDVANVTDDVEDVRTAGFANAKPAALVVLFRSPNANIIETVDRVRALAPRLRASLPASIDFDVVLDRTPPIRASLHHVELTLLASTVLVTLVVFAFLQNARAALIPTVAVPVSLVGTFGAMYLCGFSLNNLSLMALTVATGFVVDDAIVVVENVSRHVEAGLPAREAALRGAREIGFTVVSMSVSLVAVFIPLLLMGGIVGRLFREFAVTLSIAVAISLVVSLTTTAMMCGSLLRPHTGEASAWPSRALAAWAHRDDARVRAKPRLGAPPSANDAARDARHRRDQRRAVRRRPEGVLSSAGRRPADGNDHGLTGHLVPVACATSSPQWSTSSGRTPRSTT